MTWCARRAQTSRRLDARPSERLRDRVTQCSSALGTPSAPGALSRSGHIGTQTYSAAGIGTIGIHGPPKHQGAPWGLLSVLPPFRMYGTTERGT